MKFLCTLLTLLCCGLGTMAQTPIFGTATVTAGQMTEFIQKRNPDFDPEIAQAFERQGRRYGIRADVALCQAIVETGWFRFGGGTAVTPDMHNYCGLGVTSGGVKGCAFETIDDGVAAMMQHLYAYAGTEALPEGETLLDPRFNLVERGSAPTWEALSGRWAVNPAYGELILKVYGQIAPLSQSPSAPEAEEPTIGDAF